MRWSKPKPTWHSEFYFDVYNIAASHSICAAASSPTKDKLIPIIHSTINGPHLSPMAGESCGRQAQHIERVLIDPLDAAEPEPVQYIGLLRSRWRDDWGDGETGGAGRGQYLLGHGSVVSPLHRPQLGRAREAIPCLLLHNRLLDARGRRPRTDLRCGISFEGLRVKSAYVQKCRLWSISSGVVGNSVRFTRPSRLRSRSVSVNVLRKAAAFTLYGGRAHWTIAQPHDNHDTPFVAVYCSPYVPRH